MIGALSGGDSIEIIVALKDLTAKGFSQVNKNLRDMNTSASIGGSGMRNASKDAKALEKDATAAAGESKGGGIGGLASGLLALGGGPVTIAVAGLALATGAAIELGSTYDKVEGQERALDIALKDHGENADALAPKIQALEEQSTAYGYSADDVRQAITKLTEAGLSFSDVQSALPHVMDLARAKNLDLATSTDAYTSSVFGNARALKQYGIILPQVSTSAADVGKAQTAVQKATEALQKAEEKLKALQDEHVKTTTKFSSSTKGSAATAEQLSVAEQRLSIAQSHLNDLEKSGTATSTQLAQAHLSVQIAESNLQALQEKHAVTTGKLTTATKGHTASAQQLSDAEQKVRDATANLKAAQDKLTLAHQGGVNVAQRLQMVNAGLTKAVGDQRGAATEMQVAQANLNNAWENMAVQVGPGLEDLFARLVNGIAKVINFILQAIGALGQLGQKVAQVGSAIANSPIGQLAGGVGNVAGGAAGAVGGAANFLGGLIPHFASGGIVDRPTLALIGEGGEREYVIPESMMSRGGGPRGSSQPIILQIDGRTIAQILGPYIDRHNGGRLAVQPATIRPAYT